jgi:hypothetical protein
MPMDAVVIVTSNMGDTEYGWKILWQKFVFFIPHSNKCPRYKYILRFSTAQVN